MTLSASSSYWNECLFNTMSFAVFSPKYFTEMRTETVPIALWWIANSLAICHIKSEENQMCRAEQPCQNAHSSCPAPGTPSTSWGMAEKDRGGQKNPWMWKMWKYTGCLGAMLVNDTTKIQCVCAVPTEHLCVPSSDGQGDSTALGTAAAKGAQGFVIHSQ